MRRVAVRMPNWLGDGVMARAAVHDLRRSLPGTELHVFAGEPVHHLIDPEWSGVFVHRLGSGRGGRLRRIASELRGLGISDGVVFPPSFSSALAFRAGGVKRCAGFRGDNRRVLLSPAVPRSERGAFHLEDEYRALVAAALSAWGAEPRRADPIPDLSSGPETARTVQSRLHDLPRPRLVLAPGAAFGATKRWPAPSFAELASRFRARTRGSVVLTGAPADRDAASEVTSALPADVRAHVHDWVGRTSIPELIALASSADVVVTNDSGAMHVAASAGAPVVAVFGSTNPAWTGPRGRRGRRVRVVARFEPCAPCYRPTCDIGIVCLTRIPVDLVEAAVFDLLALEETA